MTTVALLGGSGRLGGRVLAQLLARGCHVRALSHRGSIAGADERMTILRGDVHDGASLAPLLDGATMVVSTLGNAEAPIPDVSATAIASLTPLMIERGVSRIVSTTGSASRLDSEIGHEPHWLAVRRAALMAHMAPFILDAEAHMRALAASPFIWTVLRAPIMQATSSRAAMLADCPAAPDTVLGYDAVAGLLVDELLEPRWIGAAPFAVPG